MSSLRAGVPLSDVALLSRIISTLASATDSRMSAAS
jgi:hypothetical protein